MGSKLPCIQQVTRVLVSAQIKFHEIFIEQVATNVGGKVSDCFLLRALCRGKPSFNMLRLYTMVVVIVSWKWGSSLSNQVFNGIAKVFSYQAQNQPTKWAWRRVSKNSRRILWICLFNSGIVRLGIYTQICKVVSKTKSQKFPICIWLNCSCFSWEHLCGSEELKETKGPELLRQAQKIHLSSFKCQISSWGVHIPEDVRDW